MTIREIGILFGIELDKKSVNKVEKELDRLKKKAQSLSNLGLGGGSNKGSSGSNGNASGRDDALIRERKAREDLARKRIEYTQNRLEQTKKKNDAATELINSRKEAVDNKEVRDQITFEQRQEDRKLKAQKKAEDEKNRIQEKAKKEREKQSKDEAKKEKDLLDRRKKEAVATVDYLKNIARTVLTAATVKTIASAMESYTLTNLSLSAALSHSTDTSTEQEQLYNLSKEVRMPYASMVSYFKSILNDQMEIFAGANGRQDGLNFIELITKELKASGITSDGIASIYSGIESSFKEGVVDSGTFNNLISASPSILGYLVDYLGSTDQDVRAMGNAGVISSQMLFKAITASSDAINKAFANTPMTFSEMVQSIKDDWGLWLADLEATTGVMEKINNYLVGISIWARNKLTSILPQIESVVEGLGGVEGILDKIVAVLLVIGGIKILSGVSSLVTSLTSLMGLLGGTSAAGGIASGLTSLSAVLGEVIIPLGVIATAIGTFGSALGGTTSDGTTVKEELSDTWDSIDAKVNAVGKSLETPIVYAGKEAAAIGMAAVGAVQWAASMGTETALLEKSWEMHNDAAQYVWDNMGSAANELAKEDLENERKYYAAKNRELTSGQRAFLADKNVRSTVLSSLERELPDWLSGYGGFLAKRATLDSVVGEYYQNAYKPYISDKYQSPEIVLNQENHFNGTTEEQTKQLEEAMGMTVTEFKSQMKTYLGATAMAQ